MLEFALKRLRRMDWLVAAAVLFLIVIGIVLIYGIGTNSVSPNQSLVTRQLIFAVIGIVCFLAASNTNYRLWAAYSKVVYLGGLLLLIAVLTIGVTIRGTTGWISLGLTSFQPVEFAKIGLIIFLAKYFSDHARHFFMWRHIIVSGIATMIYVGLVLMQPDLGSAIVICGVWFLMLLVVGIPRTHVATLLTIFLITVIAGWMFVLKDYQKDRIRIFLNPQADALGVGYNVRQSIIAVGSGQLFGRGFGSGPQSQLKFLPEAETDFIFAVLAEEFGVIGSLAVIGALLLLVYRFLTVAQRTSDNFGAFFGMGLASLFTVQSFINIGMNIGLAPVTGIPLPFISAGGSSLVSLCAAAGILSSISADARSMGSVRSS